MDQRREGKVGSGLGFGEAGHVGGNTTTVAGIESKDSIQVPGSKPECNRMDYLSSADFLGHQSSLARL
jgi:hypothetical protein